MSYRLPDNLSPMQRVAYCLAAREALRREHNQRGRDLVDFERYRHRRFLPASRAIAQQLHAAHADVPALVVRAIETAIGGGTLPTWADRPRLRLALAKIASARGKLASIDAQAAAETIRRPAVDAWIEDRLDDIVLPDVTGDGETIDPKEDYTAYTEVDTPGRVSVDSSTQITVTGQVSNETVYVYKDKGAGHFGDFSHTVDAKLTGYTGDGGVIVFHGVSNGNSGTVEGAWATINAARFGIFTEIDRVNLGGVRIMCRYLSSTDLVSGLTQDAWYYPTCQRSGTTFYVYVYSNSGRSTLVDTLSMTVATTTARFIFGESSLAFGSTATASGVIANLDLGEAAAGGPAPHFIRRSNGLTGGLCPC